MRYSVLYCTCLKPGGAHRLCTAQCERNSGSGGLLHASCTSLRRFAVSYCRLGGARVNNGRACAARGRAGTSLRSGPQGLSQLGRPRASCMGSISDGQSPARSRICACQPKRAERLLELAALAPGLNRRSSGFLKQEIPAIGASGLWASGPDAVAGLWLQDRCKLPVAVRASLTLRRNHKIESAEAGLFEETPLGCGDAATTSTAWGGDSRSGRRWGLCWWG